MKTIAVLIAKRILKTVRVRFSINGDDINVCVDLGNIRVFEHTFDLMGDGVQNKEKKL